jgi:hypothetical protein
MPYGKILFISIVGLAIFSMCDWLSLAAVDSQGSGLCIWSDAPCATVLGTERGSG